MTIQTEPQYKLRMPHELRDQLKEASKANHRSMNAEIVARLQESFIVPYAEEGESDPEALAQMRRRLDQLQLEMASIMNKYHSLVYDEMRRQKEAHDKAKEE